MFRLYYVARPNASSCSDHHGGRHRESKELEGKSPV